MDAITENPRPLAFVLSEGNGYISRENLIIASGSGKLEAGTALGKITAGGKYTFSPHAETVDIEGAETAVALLCYPIDATDADVEAVCITNDAEVKDPMLIFHSTVNDNTKRNTKLTQLRAVGIKAR